MHVRYVHSVTQRVLLKTNHINELLIYIEHLAWGVNIILFENNYQHKQTDKLRY